MNILVTGGAGYIGSVAVKELVKQNHSVTVIDNLSKGKIELVDSKAKFYNIDLTDKLKVLDVFSKQHFDVIIHFAGYKSVGESMTNAIKYSDNIVGTINLLEAMAKFGVKKIIFSSTAAVYGLSEENIINEEAPIHPINYYGVTKVTIEELLKWYARVYHIQYVALRYFNVAGDGGLNYIDPDAQNIFPIIMEVLVGKRSKLTVFGTDYDTPDGSCIRDYISVVDLVDAHIKAIKTDFTGVINIGSSTGTSVLDLIKITESVLGKKVDYVVGSRRPGDPAILVASNKRAKSVLNWTQKETVADMLLSTWNAYIKTINSTKKTV